MITRGEERYGITDWKRGKERKGKERKHTVLMREREKERERERERERETHTHISSPNLITIYPIVIDKK